MGAIVGVIALVAGGYFVKETFFPENISFQKAVRESDTRTWLLVSDEDGAISGDTEVPAILVSHDDKISMYQAKASKMPKMKNFNKLSAEEMARKAKNVSFDADTLPAKEAVDELTNGDGELVSEDNKKVDKQWYGVMKFKKMSDVKVMTPVKNKRQALVN